MVSLTKKDLPRLEKLIREKVVARNIDELYGVIDRVGIMGLFHSKHLPSVSQIVRVKAERPSWVGWGWVNTLHYERKKVIQAEFLATGNISIVSTRNLPSYYVSQKRDIQLDDQEMKIIRFLRENGATSRRDLRRALGVSGKSIGKSIRRLDSSLSIVRAGTEQPPKGWVSRVWDIWETYIPREAMDECSDIDEKDAKEFILHKYLLMRGPVTERHISKLFRWSADDVQETIDRLISHGQVMRGRFIEDTRDKTVISTENLKKLELLARA